MKFIKTIFLSLTLMTIHSSLSLSLNNNQRIPVFLAADDNYAPFVATTMASILKNTKSHIDFYVLSDGITAKNKAKIANERKWFKNFSLRFIEIDRHRYDDFFSRKNYYIAKTSYAIIDIPMFGVARNIKKTIYLDDDVIVRGDIKELYDQDLGDYVIGASYDFFHFDSHLQRYIQHFGMSKEHKSLNTGMLLINCDRWRQEGITDKLEQVDKDTRYNQNRILQDQDIFNILFNNNYKQLDRKFNTAMHYVNEFLEDKRHDKTLENEMNDSLKRAIIIHYTGKKPWKDNRILFANEFWKIVPYTDFADEIKQIHDNSQRDMKIMKNSDKNAAKINKYVRRKVKLVYILFGVLIGLNIAGLVVFARRRK